MSHSAFRLTLAAAAGAALVATALPAASAAPSTDGRGYVDSTASCPSPAVVVEYGSTDDSRVAVCRTTSGGYQYRGVRIRDGAKQILDASRRDDGAFIAENDGIEYTVAARSLIISNGAKVIREEPWTDFHSPNTATGSSTAPSSAPKSSTPSSAPTATTPLPPLLPAERGGS